MSESKTQCTTCGRLILQRTADKLNGLCAPCDADVKFNPPNDFDFPEHFAKRLRLIGLDPDDYRHSSWEKYCRSDLPVTQRFEDFVSRLEEGAARYREWLPKMTEYAEACQAEQPIMPDYAFDSFKNELRRIYSMKYGEHSEHISPHKITICRLPLIGISAVSKAGRVHDRDNAALIFLTPDELSRWEKLNFGSKSADQLCLKYCLNVDTNVRVKSLPNRQSEEIAGSELAWIVTCSSYSNSRLMHSGHELWAWNGESARFVHVFGECLCFFNP